MQRAFMIGIVAMVFGATLISANAATLPAPAKLCPLIAATAMEGNTTAPKWLASGKFYSCDSAGMISPGGAGNIFMTEYHAAGTAKAHASRIYIKFKMYDSAPQKDEVAKPILSRITAVFAAAKAGPVPDELVQAINDVATASVSTALGTIRTRYTPGSAADSPNNGAMFEVQLDVP